MSRGSRTVLRVGLLLSAFGVAALVLLVAGLTGGVPMDVTNEGLLGFIGLGACGCAAWYSWASRQAE